MADGDRTLDKAVFIRRLVVLFALSTTSMVIAEQTLVAENILIAFFATEGTLRSNLEESTFALLASMAMLNHAVTFRLGRCCLQLGHWRAVSIAALQT